MNERTYPLLEWEDDYGHREPEEEGLRVARLYYHRSDCEWWVYGGYTECRGGGFKAWGDEMIHATIREAKESAVRIALARTQAEMTLLRAPSFFARAM